jgi:hypothetical protein
MPAPVLQFKRGNAGVAGTVPALRPGEPAISLNNFDFFIGIDTSVLNNKFFGSHRYWGREDGTNALKLKLVDKDGTNYVAIKSPDTVAGIVTYTLPGTINDGYFLKTNASGVLSWEQVVSNINIAADTGTPDNVSTGATITFVGGTNINTTVTDNTITINLDNNLNVSGVTTVGTGVGITQFSSAVGSGTSTSSVPTSSAVIDYVGTQIGNVDLTLGINADTGGPSTVNTSQTLTISGTASEVETSVSGQTVTIGLPNDVVVGTSLSAPTIRTGTIQSSNTGATAITIAANDVTIADDLTVQGNLYVNGNTTQVNTTSLTVEDRTIQLGMVDGAAPSSATTWDLGVLFNYFTDSAKQSAVVWEHGDARFKFGSVISDGGGSGNDNPQITVSTFAPIEVSALWVTDCAGTSQVISCTGTERFLENITVDAGVF